MYVILQGHCLDVLRTLPSGIVNTCVTSPPYFGLRNYGVEKQIGLEPTPQAYVDSLVEVFREVRRALRDDGTLWLNLGDSYASSPKGNPGVRGNINGGKRDGVENETVVMDFDKSKLAGFKPKDLIGIPWRVAFALQQDGWYLRQDIIWHKPNPMPESVRDRCTKAHEYIFLLSKSEKYFFDNDAIREPTTSVDKRVGRSSLAFVDRSPNPRKGMRSSDPERFGLTRGTTNQPCSHPNGKNKRSVWTVSPKPFKEAHFATFPPQLIEPCILAGAPIGGLVLDPFGGAGTTALVCEQLGRKSISIELNPVYVEMARRRVEAVQPMRMAAE